MGRSWNYMFCDPSGVMGSSISIQDTDLMIQRGRRLSRSEVWRSTPAGSQIIVLRGDGGTTPEGSQIIADECKWNSTPAGSQSITAIARTNHSRPMQYPILGRQANDPSGVAEHSRRAEVGSTPEGSQSTTAIARILHSKYFGSWSTPFSFKNAFNSSRNPDALAFP